jgi:hypothetical protein
MGTDNLLFAVGEGTNRGEPGSDLNILKQFCVHLCNPWHYFYEFCGYGLYLLFVHFMFAWQSSIVALPMKGLRRNPADGGTQPELLRLVSKK